MDTFKKELSTVTDSTSLIPYLSAAKTLTEVKNGVFVQLGYGNVAKVKTLPALYQPKCQGDIGRDTQQHRSYLKLKGDVTDVKFIINQLLLPKIAELEGKHNLSGHRIYYLALPPQFFNATIKALGEAGLFTDRTNKIVVEKPVGKDKASAKEIIDVLRQYCLPSQVYFLDHYNGKESIRILECMKGDQTWFVSAEEILASWDAVAPIMERLNASETNGNDALTIHQYERGTDGPDAAQEIMTRDGRHWSDLSERLNRYQ